MDAFFHAVAFLTRLPVPKQLEAEAWAKSPPWYPVVGVMLGALLAVLAWALGRVAPPLVLAMVLVSAWAYLTGGLHLDGLMDTADGFWSHRSKERVLEIMKDSRVGGMGVLAAVLVIGNKVAALSALHGATLWIGLVLAPLLGRTAMLAALLYLPYARPDGLAQSLREASKGRAVASFLLAAGVFAGSVVWLEGRVVLVFFMTAIVAAVLLRASLKKIDGCTGDVYGALCELIETAVLVALAVGGGGAWS